MIKHLSGLIADYNTFAPRSSIVITTQSSSDDHCSGSDFRPMGTDVLPETKPIC